jgi:hypothetical protein
VPGQVASARLPRLSLSFVTKNVDEGPSNFISPVEVDANGNVVFPSGKSVETRLTVVNSQGQVVARFGRTGSGPGEVRDARPIGMSAAGPSTWDLPLNRLTEWDLKGAVRASPILPSAGRIVTSAPGGYLGLDMVAGKPAPFLVSQANGGKRALLPATDTFSRAHFTSARTAPLLGLWQDGFLLGDATEYRIAMYRWDGSFVRVLSREVPVEHPSKGRIETLLKPMLGAMRAAGKEVNEADLSKQRAQIALVEFPRLMPGGTTRPDARNRLWFLGIDGDEAFADVFTASAFLGRIHIPCKGFMGGWGINSTWLAVSCQPDDSAFEGDAVVKLFRIVE